MKRLLCGLLWLGLAVSLPVAAHKGDEAAAAGVIDCEHPPAKLARRLPAAVAGPAILVCTPAVQLITAHEGWTWRFPGSYFDRPSIPAYAPLESRGNAGGRYFTGFKADELASTEVAKLHEKFSKTLVTYVQSPPPARVVRLVATNDEGHSLQAYFGFQSKDEGWVALCAPTCEPEFFFLIARR
ncbi:MAG TPA: hypothetical protein VFV71_09940 [Burkholderiales bacterium]|nr:hypothetical protein [Burkholderiales bacterium]